MINFNFLKIKLLLSSLNQKYSCWLNCTFHLAMLFYWTVHQEIVGSIGPSVNSISQLFVNKCLCPVPPILHCHASSPPALLSVLHALFRGFSNFYFQVTELLFFLLSLFPHLLTNHLHHVSKVQPTYQLSTVVAHLCNAWFFDAREMGWEIAGVTVLVDFFPTHSWVKYSWVQYYPRQLPPVFS